MRLFQLTFLIMLVLGSCQPVEKPSYQMPDPVAAGQTFNAAFLIIDGVYNSELMAPYDVLQPTVFRDDANYIRCFIVTPDGRPFETFEGMTRLEADLDAVSAETVITAIGALAKLPSREELLAQRTAVEQFEVEGDLRREISMNIKRLMDIGCYCINVIRLMSGQEPDQVRSIIRWGERSQVDETLSGILSFFHCNTSTLVVVPV